MPFPSIEAKLEYACDKMRNAGWTLSLAPEKEGQKGWRMVKGGVTHDLYAPTDIVKQLGGEDRGRMLLDQHLCSRALEIAGLKLPGTGL